MRLFIAIPLPDEVKRELKNLQQPIESITWQAATQHITLRFLGETPQHNITALKKNLGDIQHHAFRITIEELGCFFRDDIPRIIWAGVKKNDALKQLHATVKKAFRGMDFPPPRHPFKPHITLGRVTDTSFSQKITTFINRRKKWGSMLTFVDCFVLYASRLSKEGAEHIPLQTYPLRH